MNPTDHVYVAGHRGLVGSGLVRRLESAGYTDLVLRTREQLDLTDGAAVERFFAAERPSYVFLAAAKVGGIVANDTYPADFIRDNLAIQLHVIDAAYRHGVKRLLFLGSSCVYPRDAPQPLREEYLLTGPLEQTNEAYAIAKIAGIKMCEAYRRQFGAAFTSVMPTNLYGPRDNFDLETSHVIPALIRRFHEAHRTGARSVRLWGTGTPRREFLHVDDMADACVYLMESDVDCDLVNVGWGQDIAIAELAALIADIVGFSGTIEWDTSRPDGTPRKRLDTTRLTRLEWRPRIALREGLRETVEWYARTTSHGARLRANATRDTLPRKA